MGKAAGSDDWSPTFLCAPTERELVRIGLGRSSSLPERHGADVLWMDPVAGGLVGVQRKEIKDLVASVQDGRLAKEVGQLGSVKRAFLILEGNVRWTTEGVCMNTARWTHWTRQQHRGLLRSVADRGILVEYSEDVRDTAEVVRDVARWVHKGEHLSLDRRGGPEKSAWGRSVGNQAWMSHFLQGIPGIGPGQAKGIIDHFGGVPMKWTVDKGELLKVKGLGPKRVEAMMKVLGVAVVAT